MQSSENDDKLKLKYFKMSWSESAGKTANKCPGNSSELSIPVKVSSNLIKKKKKGGYFK